MRHLLPHWLPQASALSCPLPASWPWLSVVPYLVSLPCLPHQLSVGAGWGVGPEERKRSQTGHTSSVNICAFCLLLSFILGRPMCLLFYWRF